LATQVVVAPASPVIVALPGEILYTSEKEKEMIQKRTNEKGKRCSAKPLPRSIASEGF
jgi:predicted ATPase